MTFGERIAARRKDLDWSQEELAQKMGYKSRSSINKIELDINDVPQSTILKFSEVLGVSLAYLMGYEEKVPELSETKKELIEIIKRMSEEDAVATLRILRR